MAEYRRIPMKPEDVGGALISILSEGLYTDPFHAIREYVQNSIDADAHHVVIKMTGRSVIISDDGCGMNFEELQQARQVGISKKDYSQYVGFRGIGIYSGLALCNHMTITTQKSGEPYQYVLRFDFKGMRDQIDRERKDRSRVTSLMDLIYEYSEFAEEEGDPSRSGTVVELQEVSRPHLERLYNVEEMRKYLMRTVPVDFADDFPHRDLIVSALSRLPGYRAAQILIQADGHQDILVARPPIPDLLPPQMGYLKDNNGNNIAFYWWCAHANREKIPDRYREYRGFVYKLKGFTIGDNNLLRPLFKRGGGILYEWIVGEIHVLDEDVVPNAGRDNFQPSISREILQSKVNGFLAEVEGEVDRRRAEERARTVLASKGQDIRRVQEELDDEIITTNYWDLLAKVQSAISEIEKQESNLPASERPTARTLKEQARRLEEQIRRRIESPDRPYSPQARRKKTRKTSTLPAQQASFPQLQLSASVERSLLQIVRDAGWEVPETCEHLFTIIDRVLLAEVPESRPRILAHIEQALEEKGE